MNATGTPMLHQQRTDPTLQQLRNIGDLNRRRGKIHAVEAGSVSAVLSAEVPLSELWGYANAIRSLSRGRASYSMTPSHFEQVPETLAGTVVEELRSK